MENNTRHTIAKAGVWGVCIAFVFSVIVNLLYIVIPLVYQDSYDFYEKVGEFNMQTGPMLQFLCKGIFIVAYSLLAVGFTNLWIRTFSICFVVTVSTSILALDLNSQILSAISVIPHMIGFGALCGCRQLLENKRNLLIWYIGLGLAAGVIAFWSSFAPSPENIDYTVSEMMINISNVRYLYLAIDITSCALFIKLWMYIYRAISGTDDESPAIAKLIVNKYSLTFIGIFLVSLLVYYLVWDAIIS